MWLSGSRWKRLNIDQYLSEYNQFRLLSMVIDEVTRAKDQVIWGGSMNEFESCGTKESSCLLMVDSQHAIMTNAKRRRRHLSDSYVCFVCHEGVETILHVLRNCPSIKGVWQRLVPENYRRQFFSQSLLEWLYQNLGKKDIIFESSWSTCFAMGIWWRWKWRCGNVFGFIQPCRDHVQFVKTLSREVSLTHAKSANSTTVRRSEVLQIRWFPPLVPRFKLNTNGVSKV